MNLSGGTLLTCVENLTDVPCKSEDWTKGTKMQQMSCLWIFVYILFSYSWLIIRRSPCHHRIEVISEKNKTDTISNENNQIYSSHVIVQVYCSDLDFTSFPGNEILLKYDRCMSLLLNINSRHQMLMDSDQACDQESSQSVGSIRSSSVGQRICGNDTSDNATLMVMLVVTPVNLSILISHSRFLTVLHASTLVSEFHWRRIFGYDSRRMTHTLLTDMTFQRNNAHEDHDGLARLSEVICHYYSRYLLSNQKSFETAGPTNFVSTHKEEQKYKTYRPHTCRRTSQGDDLHRDNAVFTTSVLEHKQDMSCTRQHNRVCACDCVIKWNVTSQDMEVDAVSRSPLSIFEMMYYFKLLPPLSH